MAFKRNVKTEEHLKSIADFTQVMMGYHFSDTQSHFSHVRNFTKLLCSHYNSTFPENAIPETELPLIFEGAAMHDIGLIAIPDNLIVKKGDLSDEERKLFRDHTVVGAKIIDRMSEIYKLTDREQELIRNICLYHHERYDGNGYPAQLEGDNIPIEAQIVSLAEVYDALTRNNYSEGRTHEEAYKTIMEGKCGVFNPKLLTCFTACAEDMQLLLECKDNKERALLLQRTYGRNRKQYWKLKRTADILISTVGLLVLSPLLLLIAAVIFIDDPHASPIFKQIRVGRHKKEFVMYKFRTMYKDAEERKKELEKLNEKDGPVFKIANDPRITRVGKWLRKTSLDELPQLVNILKGDMTLVGPRPPLPSEVKEYSRYTDMRLSVTPGLTCIWQVQPDRDGISFDEWMDMDIAYIGTRSVKDDIKLLFLTIKSVFSKSGS